MRKIALIITFCLSRLVFSQIAPDHRSIPKEQFNTAKNDKLNNVNNPLDLNEVFTADPAAHVWKDGKLWLYTSHDAACMQSFNAMSDYKVFSSEDAINWTEYPDNIISIDELNKKGFNVIKAWAPDVAYKNGKYYFYFPVQKIEDGSWYIMVMHSLKPQGPFSEPKVLAQDWGIDPSILIDDDGRAYLYCDNKVGELNEDMMSIKEGTEKNIREIAEMPYPKFEGPFIFKRESKYYLITATDGYARLIYFMSDAPFGPWELKGTLMAPDPQFPKNNNQGSVVKYKGKWILFYHRKGCWHSRKTNAEYLKFNNDGAIPEIKRSKEGISFTSK